tara:strand:+ start:36 stop:671 length:636 start_codon:yes stop_codon:yes gene_type:complete
VIGIIDYEFGNTQSVENSIEYLGFKKKKCRSKIDFKNCTHIILPGVGSFNKCMQALKDLDLLDILNQSVIDEKKFYLGICVGFQILFTSGVEGKKTKGLGWLEGECKKLKDSDNIRLPHMGWNTIENKNNIEFFNHINPQDLNFYFLHSYVVKNNHLNTGNLKFASTKYGEDFVSAVQKDNILGVQFHPEKSQDSGLQFLKNFCEQNNEHA